MKYTVVMTPQASHELEGMADWWAENRFREQAGRWYTGISDEIDRLSENPQRWALSKESDDFPFELRELHFGLGQSTFGANDCAAMDLLRSFGASSQPTWHRHIPQFN